MPASWLFNRTTRSVSQTGAGRAFVLQVGPAMTDIHQAMDAARARQEIPSGTFRINAFAFAAREILAPLILPFLRRYPPLPIDLVTEGRIVDIYVPTSGRNTDARRCALTPISPDISL